MSEEGALQHPEDEWKDLSGFDPDLRSGISDLKLKEQDTTTKHKNKRTKTKHETKNEAQRTDNREQDPHVNY